MSKQNSEGGSSRRHYSYTPLQLKGRKKGTKITGKKNKNRRKKENINRVKEKETRKK